MASQSVQPKKSSLGVLLFLIVLIIGGGVAGLHFTGKLQPILDIILGKKEGQPLPDVAVEIIPTPERKMPEPVIESAPSTEVVEKAVGSSVEPVRALTQEEKLMDVYRQRFKAPEIGQTLAVEINGKSTQSGILTYIDEKGLKLKSDKIEMTLVRNQLAPKGLARCYEDEYVKYMLARQQNRDAALAVLQKQEEQLAASYAKFMASRGKTINVSSRNTAKTAKESIHDMDFKAWMEENGQTDALKARQERIRAYEAEQRKAAAAKRAAD